MKLVVYKSIADAWCVRLKGGTWVMYRNDCLVFEKVPITWDSHYSRYTDGLQLIKMWIYKYDIDGDIVKTGFVWKELDFPVTNVRFEYGAKSTYSLIDVVFKGGLEDVSISWNRDNKLEELGICI